ncbi:MAG: diphthine--ammonia ligase [Sarcina sp.]
MIKDLVNGARGKKFVASFSGGKDSTLALYKAMEEGTAVGLVVMMEEDGERSRSHSMFPKILDAQAKAIGLPIYKGAASWATYKDVFIENLKKAKEVGAEVLITGDIDMLEHASWYEGIANEIGLGLAMPLWNKGHREVVEEFISLGFITKIVTINLEKGMKEEDLGRTLTLDYMKELEKRGIDPCGESGEFHTTVIAGPIFTQDIKVMEDKVIKDENYMYLTLELNY